MKRILIFLAGLAICIVLVPGLIWAQDILPDTVWTRIFGGSVGDVARYVQQTSDGGYILAGGTRSYGAGKDDVWLIKTDAQGKKLWDHTFGGLGYDVANSVQQTSDGGYILAGWTISYGAGVEDAWIIKTNANGQVN